MTYHQVLGHGEERLPAGGAREGGGEEGRGRAHAQLGAEGLQEVHHGQDGGAQGEEGRAGGRGEGGLREDPRQHVQPVLLAQAALEEGRARPGRPRLPHQPPRLQLQRHRRRLMLPRDLGQ